MVGRRAVHTRRDSKQVPGHHVQVDVTFLWLKDSEGRKVRRFQYTASRRVVPDALTCYAGGDVRG